MATTFLDLDDPGSRRFTVLGANIPQSRGGYPAAVQIGYIGEIPSNADIFALSHYLPFNIKNETGSDVTLEVRLAQMPENTFVSTVFGQGWNPEIVIEVKPNGTSGLKFGF